MVCSLRGSVCVYQGEELGLTEADVPFESLQDPYGITFWPTFKGRDGCRTPMPWNGGINAGFSVGDPWLPVPAEHRALAVTLQDATPDSTLNGFRHFMAWRKTQPALRWGSIQFIDTPEPVLAFTRKHGDDTLLVAFNLSKTPVELPLAGVGKLTPVNGHGLSQGGATAGGLSLPGHGALFARVG
jgi:alpha-glucosidase